MSGATEPALALKLTENAELCGRLLSRQLGRILRLVDVELHGAVVDVDGFALGSRLEPELSIPVDQRVRYEARLEVIQKGLQRALHLGRFLRNEEALAADGFRLRDLTQWA